MKKRLAATSRAQKAQGRGTLGGEKIRHKYLVERPVKRRGLRLNEPNKTRPGRSKGKTEIRKLQGHEGETS